MDVGDLFLFLLCKETKPSNKAVLDFFFPAFQEYLLRGTQSLQEVRGVIESAVVKSGTSHEEEDHVDLFNLTEAMKRRSPGRDVC